jgi:hypothetical protein
MPESSNAILISLIFLGGLAGFASDRLRHDLVALLMLAACLVLGLVPATRRSPASPTRSSSPWPQ